MDCSACRGPRLSGWVRRAGRRWQGRLCDLEPFLLAVANAHAGHVEEARSWYEDASSWLGTHSPQAETRDEYLALLAETSALLGPAEPAAAR